ncbi:MAG: hypothetical protein WCJ70_03605 [bacterium]
MTHEIFEQYKPDPEHHRDGEPEMSLFKAAINKLRALLSNLEHRRTYMPSSPDAQTLVSNALNIAGATVANTEPITVALNPIERRARELEDSAQREQFDNIIDNIAKFSGYMSRNRSNLYLQVKANVWNETGAHIVHGQTWVNSNNNEWQLHSLPFDDARGGDVLNVDHDKFRLCLTRLFFAVDLKNIVHAMIEQEEKPSFITCDSNLAFIASLCINFGFKAYPTSQNLQDYPETSNLSGTKLLMFLSKHGINFASAKYSTVDLTELVDNLNKKNIKELTSFGLYKILASAMQVRMKSCRSPSEFKSMLDNFSVLVHECGQLDSKVVATLWGTSEYKPIESRYFMDERIPFDDIQHISTPGIDIDQRVPVTISEHSAQATRYTPPGYSTISKDPQVHYAIRPMGPDPFKLELERKERISIYKKIALLYKHAANAGYVISLENLNDNLIFLSSGEVTLNNIDHARNFQAEKTNYPRVDIKTACFTACKKAFVNTSARSCHGYFSRDRVIGTLDYFDGVNSIDELIERLDDPHSIH